MEVATDIGVDVIEAIAVRVLYIKCALPCGTPCAYVLACEAFGLQVEIDKHLACFLLVDTAQVSAHIG